MQSGSTQKDKIAKRSDWKIKEMPEQVERFVIKCELTEKQLSNLRRGHIPQEMEDKWFFFMEQDTLYAHRSWTGYCIYIAEFKKDNIYVTVNRDPEQYTCTDALEDGRKFIDLLSYWAQDEYDYYGEWITETYNSLVSSFEHGEKSKSYERAKDYFKFKRGLANDFIFPGYLLDELKPWERAEIEGEIINRSLGGDSRFFGALVKVRHYDLCQYFTLERMAEITGQTRAKLLRTLYFSTYDPLYLRSLIYMMPVESWVAPVIGKLLADDDWWDSGILDSPEFNLILIALDTVREIRGKAEKATPIIGRTSKVDEKRICLLLSKSKDLPELDREQLGIMADTGDRKFIGWEEYGLYWEALGLRMDYIETGNKKILGKIVRYSLIRSYIYDVLNYMYKNGEADEADILGCTAFVQEDRGV